MYPSRIRTGTRQDRLVATIGPPDFFPPTISFRILSSTQPRHTEETGTKPPPVPVTLFFVFNNSSAIVSSHSLPKRSHHYDLYRPNYILSLYLFFFFPSLRGSRPLQQSTHRLRRKYPAICANLCNYCLAERRDRRTIEFRAVFVPFLLYRPTLRIPGSVCHICDLIHYLPTYPSHRFWRMDS